MLEWRLLHPWVLFLLPIPILLLVWHLRSRKRRHPSFIFSGLEPLRAGGETLKIRALRWLPWIRTLALILGIVALARPQYGQVQRSQSALGLDIVMALDISGTMDAIDFKPTRLEAAKSVLKEFAANRLSDRMSVVIFGTNAYLLVPPTFDRHAVQEFIDVISSRVFSNDQRNTAIGMGLALAVDKLKDSNAKSKVVILLTDGENTAGNIQPLQAAEAAKALGVRVYTIGVGSNSVVSMEVPDAWGRRRIQNIDVRIDEDTLKKIADMTGGKYFRATNEKALQEIYNEIDKLEKTEIQVSEYDDFDERFMWLWTPALLLLGGEYILRTLWLVRLP